MSSGMALEGHHDDWGASLVHEVRGLQAAVESWAPGQYMWDTC